MCVAECWCKRVCALVFVTCYYQNTDLMSKVGTFLGSGVILSSLFVG